MGSGTRFRVSATSGGRAMADWRRQHPWADPERRGVGSGVTLTQGGADAVAKSPASKGNDEADVRIQPVAGPVVAGPYDAVLLFGPLYHLLVREERERAIAAALQRLRQRGDLPVAFADVLGFRQEVRHLAGIDAGLALDALLQ